jgi:hypothetical protein
MALDFGEGSDPIFLPALTIGATGRTGSLPFWFIRFGGAIREAPASDGASPYRAPGAEGNVSPKSPEAKAQGSHLKIRDLHDGQSFIEAA